eukprot:7601673-Pyramimonas_sp.AAC.1
MNISPRAPRHASDDECIVLARLCGRCECLGRWPDKRTYTTLVRLPKEGRGSRLIALVNSLVRLRARARSIIIQAVGRRYGGERSLGRRWRWTELDSRCV